MKKKLFLVLMAILFCAGLVSMTCVSDNQQNGDLATLETAKAEICLIDQEPFILTISVEETTLPQGQNFKVNVELKNNSGEDHEIFYDYLFWPRILGWNLLHEQSIVGPPWFPHHISRLFEAGSILRNIETHGFKSGSRFLGATLTPGTHELRFDSRFTLNRGREDSQLIQVLSNPIIITVLQNAQENENKGELP